MPKVIHVNFSGNQLSSNKPVSMVQSNVDKHVVDSLVDIEEVKSNKDSKLAGKPYKIVVSLDKISVTMNRLSPEELEDVVTNIKSCNYDPEFFASVFVPSNYRAQIKIRVTPTETVLMQAGPKNKKGAQVRLEWNPSKIGAAGHHKLRAVLESMLPHGYNHFLDYGYVTRYDVAVDIYGYSPSELAFSSESNVNFSTYNKAGDTQTIYLGSKTSQHRWVIYDKAAQLKLNGGEKITRIERRIKPHDMRFFAMNNYPCPLSNLSVTISPIGTKAPPGLDADIWKLFRELCKHVPQHKAMCKLNKETRKIVSGYLKPKQQKWWKPIELWNEWKPHLIKLTLLSSLHGKSAMKCPKT